MTLALRNLFSLGSGAGAVYTTRTFFGSGAPEDVAAVPEPSSLSPLALGAFGLRAVRRRMQRRRDA